MNNEITTIVRIIKEHKEKYIITYNNKDLEAVITGKLRFSAESREDFPAVGDYVTVNIIEDDQAIIQEIEPRKSMLARKSISSDGEKQIIATNIDISFIIQSVDQNFNLNRLERYITISIAGKITPVIILSKIDLIDAPELLEKINLIKERNKDITVLAISNISKEGLDKLLAFMEINKTYCFLGSSGVGKSTIINSLMNKDLLETKEISTQTGKGKHTTTHRELISLSNGSFVIDTPGMREIGVTDDAEGLESIYSEIYDLEKKCKFTDCSHTNEPGCAVNEAIKNGTLDKDKLKNFKKLERETIHYQSSQYELRKKDKAFGKMVKDVMSQKKR